MPTYEYKCKACDHQFEIVQKMSDPVLTTCPQCQGAIKRLIGAGAGLIFKGSGFYITDNRSENYKKGAAASTTGSTPPPPPSSPSSSTPSGSASGTSTT